MADSTTIALFTQFQQISDPRVERTRLHNLYEMIVLAITATICGANGWADVERFGKAKLKWFRKFLTLENGIPSHDTFGRVFARLDTEQFLTCLSNWIEMFQDSMQGRGVAIDGKTLRRSFDKASGKKALHVVSAWATDLRICLGQVAVDEKSNEIPAVPRLLEYLELTGAVVTLDAMHCQKETAKSIINAGADYILPVKGNQPSLHSTVSQAFMEHGEDESSLEGVRTHKSSETNRGRVEDRICQVAPAPLDLKAEWPGIKSMGVLYRYREEPNGKVEEAVTYFISSLVPSVRKIAGHLRSHWGVENGLHWVLDVTFSEDDSRIRKDNSPEIAAIFRRMALSILKRDTTVNSSIRGKRLQAGWNSELLEKILTGIQHK